MKKILSVGMIFLFVFSTSIPAFAATDTWVGNASANFGDNNWSSNPLPSSGDTLAFGTAGSSGTSLTDNVSGLSVTGITYNSGASAFTIGGSDALNIGGAINNNSNSDQVLSMAIAGTSIISAGTGTGSVTLSGGVNSTVTTIYNGSSTSDLDITTDPVSVNAGGTTLVNFDNANLTVSGGISGTGNLILENDDSGNLTISTNLINNSGTILNNGTGETAAVITGGIGSNVTAIEQSSTSSGLNINSNIAVNTGGTTLIEDQGAASLSMGGDVTGTGNFTLENNGTTGTGSLIVLSDSGDTIDNIGELINTGTGTGETTISNIIGSNVTSVVQDSSGTLDLTNASNNYSGTTLVETGTLTIGNNNAVPDTTDVTISNGATFDLASYSDNLGSLAGAGTVTSSEAGAVTLTTGTDNGSTTFTGIIQNGSGTVGLTKAGTGTFTISGANTYTGATTISDGTLQTAATDTISSSSDVTVGASGTLDMDGKAQNVGSIAGAGTITNSSATAAVLTAGGDNSSTVFSGILEDGTGTFGLTKTGTGTLTLSGASNDYSGPTDISAGILKTAAVAAVPDTSALTIANGATLDMDGNNQDASTLSGAGTVTSSVAGTAILDIGDADAGTATFSGTIQDGSGQVEIDQSGGTETLTGDNTYSGGTIVGGTLIVGNVHALGTGEIQNEGTLNIANYGIAISGPYIQDNGTLDLTINSATTYASITSTSATKSDFIGANTINVTVSGYIRNGSTIDIINTNGTGILGSAPATVTSNNSDVTFTDSIVNGNLVLTVDNTQLPSFSSLANNHNAFAVATVLDNITNASTDMNNVLNTLGSLTDAQVTAALNTMGPIVDAGVLDTTSAELNNFMGATLDRAQSVVSGNAGSGVSSGDTSDLNNLWAKQFGGYLDQGTRDDIQGYNAWNTGTVLGIDHMFGDSLTMGVSAGYAYGSVSSDANNANENINSAQGGLYAGYQGVEHPYFVDLAGTYAENWYSGQRDISIGSLNRVASSQYDGDQFGTFAQGGYKFNFGDIALTPEASLQWTHLGLNSYTESNAGALDLNVDRQSYNNLESAVGASISTQGKYSWGDLTPEFHAKWTYDFIDDDMVLTSAFTGGGASFTSVGASPAKDGANLGGKLTFDLKNDISVIGGCDTEIKDDFFGVSGSVTVQYKF